MQRSHARGGQYTFRVQAAGGGTSAELWAELLQQVDFRLVLFRYATPAKDATQAQVLASVSFAPRFAAGAVEEKFTLSTFQGSRQPGANFSIGNGLGVAVVAETRRPIVAFSPELAAGRVYLRLARVELEFSPKPRDEQVTV